MLRYLSFVVFGWCYWCTVALAATPITYPVLPKPYEGIVRYDLLGNYIQAWDCPEDARVLNECTGGYRILRILERNREGQLSGIWIAHPYGQHPTITPEYWIDVVDYVEPVLGAQRIVSTFKIAQQPGKTSKQTTWSTFSVTRHEAGQILGISHDEYGFFRRNTATVEH